MFLGFSAFGNLCCNRGDADFSLIGPARGVGLSGAGLYNASCRFPSRAHRPRSRHSDLARVGGRFPANSIIVDYVRY